MPTSRKSIAYFGTDDLAATVLERLHGDAHFKIDAVITPPDAPAGRGRSLFPCPVKQFASRHHLDVFHDPRAVLGLSVDFIVVAVYGRILPPELLTHPRFGAVNVHPSLLPKYRGPSPIRAALLHGDRVTGVSIMKMEPTLDTGPVYSFSEFVIQPHHNAESLRHDLARLAAELLAQTLPGIAHGEIDALPQDEANVSYSPKVSRESAEIVWELDDAVTLKRKLKAYYPWPGLYTYYKGKRLKILSAHEAAGDIQQWGLVHCEDSTVWVDAREGRLVLERVQLEGKKEALILDFIRGYPDFVRTVLGKPS